MGIQGNNERQMPSTYSQQNVLFYSFQPLSMLVGENDKRVERKVHKFVIENNPVLAMTINYAIFKYLLSKPADFQKRNQICVRKRNVIRIACSKCSFLHFLACKFFALQFALKISFMGAFIGCSNCSFCILCLCNLEEHFILNNDSTFLR